MPEPAPAAAWVIPFAGLLLTIALAPLAAPRLWHAHYGKVAAAWALALVIPFALENGLEAASHLAAEALVDDYLPFIALLVALFAVTGGVRLTGTLRGTPGVNTMLLLAGTLAASVIGTTGAAMLLVRPLLRANRRRRHKRHVFVFLIILVGNIGGALSPLGDPPLFIGFLEGVPFFWPTIHLFLPMVTIGGLLLISFYFIDRHWHRRAPAGDPSPLAEVEKLGLRGGVNFLLLPLILAIVVAGGVWDEGLPLGLRLLPVLSSKAVTTILLLGVAALSQRFTDPALRRANEFDWAAMVEVAILFAAIFITIAPALAILHAGAAGPAAPLVPILAPGGVPDDRAVFWVTGLLSAVLDNAPTYLLFFSLAGESAEHLIASAPTTLAAISAGAVFFGALTYIGNAPNLMVKSVVERGGVAMPSFFAYIGWALVLLLPPLALVTWIFL